MTTETEHRAWVDTNKRMFAGIVRRYDMMNTVMTFGRDAAWRKETAAAAAPRSCRLSLDMATGTGELAFTLAQRSAQVIGLDISPEMVAAASDKLSRKQAKGATHFIVGDGLRLPFPDATFDAATTGFALRNVADVDRALQELYRVLKPGGRLACLEMSRSSFRPLAALHMIYIAGVVPFLGWLLASNAKAYRYLSTSLGRFLTPGQLQERLYEAGFRHVDYRLYQFHSIAIHVATK